MTDYEKEKMDEIYKGMTLEQRMYLLTRYVRQELIAEVDRRMEVQENSISNAKEALSAT